MFERLKYLYRAYRFRYKIDPQEIAYLLDTLQPGQVAIDIGAHKGGYLYWMRQQVGAQGRVYAFEPQKKLYDYLTMIVQAAGFAANVTVENMGLSSEPGTVHFHIPRTRSGASPGARIDALPDADDFDRTDITVTTLDDYFLPLGVAPALLKIDVEGHERQVLQGGRQLLATHQPTILMECENRHLVGETVADVFRFLLDMGYTGHFFNRGALAPLSQFSAEVHQPFGEGRFWEADGYVNNFLFRVDHR